jgi:hypothetical protein
VFDSRKNKTFSLLQAPYKFSGDHLAFYTIGMVVFISPALKLPCRDALTFNKCRSLEHVDLYIHFPIRVHGVVLT